MREAILINLLEILAIGIIVGFVIAMLYGAQR